VSPFAGPQKVELNITGGIGMGQTLLDFENSLPGGRTVQFYNPYVLNAVDPKRMLIGTKYLYESTDRGDSLNNLLNVPEMDISSKPQFTSLAYGSQQQALLVSGIDPSSRYHPRAVVWTDLTLVGIDQCIKSCRIDQPLFD
jgi:hypothetical protein